jgi:replicative DNA helicase
MNQQIPEYLADFAPVDLYDTELLELKQPPHSVESEQAVIGGLLISQNAFDAIADLITENDFYRQDHRTIFAAIAKLATDAKPHDVITVQDVLASTGTLESVGGIAYLFELANNTASVANIRAYANVIRERSVLRNLIAAGQTIADSAYAPNGRSAVELIDEAQAAVIALGDAGGGEQDLHVTGALKAYVEELHRRADAGGMVGLSTGFAGIDTRTNGLMPGNLIIIGGRPKSGKSTLAMNIAEHVAVTQQKPVLVFSMEMTRLELIDRMVASVGSIPFSLLRSGAAVSHYEHSSSISPAVRRIKSAPLYIDDRMALSIAQMRSAARRQHRKTPLSLVVVDYLQLARAPGSKKSEGRVQEIAEIGQGLKALGKELGCPVIALSQLNRNCETQKRKPAASDLRDSGAIEQDADGIFLIYRDKVYNEDSPMGDTAEIIIAALRNGEAGTEYLDANLAMCRFQNKAHSYRPPDPAPIKSSGRKGGFDL